MKNIKLFITIIATLMLSFLLYECSTTSSELTKATHYDTIKSGFKTPTDDNTLWCYWYWIGDDISKEGITKDLEAMKAAGIGGADGGTARKTRSVHRGQRTHAGRGQGTHARASGRATGSRADDRTA
jgi:hypothetical protein